MRKQTLLDHKPTVVNIAAMVELVFLWTRNIPLLYMPQMLLILFSKVSIHDLPDLRVPGVRETSTCFIGTWEHILHIITTELFP